jgi:hypothetical protein
MPKGEFVGQFAQVVAQVLSLMSNLKLHGGSLRVPSEFGNQRKEELQPSTS